MLVGVLLPLLVLVGLQAAEQSYDYDARGRLVRSAGSGSAVEYRYDAAGNLLEVTGGVAALPPTISSFIPSSVRRGTNTRITVSGSHLAFSGVSAPAGGFIVGGVSANASNLSFDLSVPGDAPLGVQTFTVSNAAGSAVLALQIEPLLPVLSVAPLPLAIPPDAAPHSFLISLANADTVAHQIALSTANPSIATVTPASLMIAPGQTTVLAGVTGLAAGSTSLVLSSPTLTTIQVPVFVTAEFAGINTSHAPLLGVVLETTPEPPVQQSVVRYAPADVGVVIGAHLQAIAPRALAAGTSATLVLTGRGLEQAVAAALLPADGVSVGTLSVAADGLSATLPITVTAGAAVGPRQLVLGDAAGVRIPSAHAEGDRVLIGHPAPVVESVSPLSGEVGLPLTVTVRGRNLQHGGVQLMPGTGIQVDSRPEVSADGRMLTFRAGIGSLLSSGRHTVVVTTPTGSSGETAGPNNTFTVVDAAIDPIGPIDAPALGVVLLADAPPAEGQPVAIGATPIGIAIGPVVSELSPRVGIVGETLDLLLRGNELDAASALVFSPSDGLTVQSLSVAPDGRTVSARVHIATDAPRTIRGVSLLAGAAALPASTAQMTFAVIAPLPRLDSVAPINVQVGTGPVAMTLRGAHFNDATSVTALPPEGISISQPPVVNSGADEIAVSVTVAAGAAPGPRVLVVSTPAGSTVSLGAPSNTMNLVTGLGDTVTPIHAPALGVVLSGEVGPPAGVAVDIPASDVGVVLQTEVAPPLSRDAQLLASPVGVLVGPTALSIGGDGLVPGATTTLEVTGFALDRVSSVQLVPGAGLVLGPPLPAADGFSVTIPVQIAGDAPSGLRELRLDAAGERIPFADAASAQVFVATGVPVIESISPILARQGDSLSLVVRGRHLQRATVSIEPSAGVVLGSSATVSADGTRIDTTLSVAPDASLGGRVLRVRTSGGATTELALPANTFTVYPP